MKALMAALLLTAACDHVSPDGRSEIQLAPFRELARESPCAESRNLLFLIDRQRVFWDRAGACPDNAYAQTLFGGTPQDVLCSHRDSIAGPAKSCEDQSQAALFDVILGHLGEPDLGLGSGHTVDPIAF